MLIMQRARASRLDACVRRRLDGDKFSVVGFASDERSPPRYVALTAELFGQLQADARRHAELIQGGLEETRRQNAVLKGQVSSLMKELARARGEDYQLSHEGWKEVSQGILDLVEPGLKGVRFDTGLMMSEGGV